MDKAGLGWVRGGLVVLLCAGISACGKPAVGPVPESEALARSRLLLSRIGRLEADLHAETAKIAVYDTLEDRHGQASQMACRVTDEHVNEMHRLLVAQIEKRREKAEKKRRVALLSRPSQRRQGRVAPVLARNGPLSLR